MSICHYCLLMHTQASQNLCFFAMLIIVWIWWFWVWVSLVAFFFFAGAGCGVPSHSPSPLPCSYIPLALEKTSLFNFLPYQDLPLLCYPAMFWLSHFLHVHTNYYMFILINTVEKLLSFYLNCVAGGDFLRVDNASASFFIRITPE